MLTTPASRIWPQDEIETAILFLFCYEALLDSVILLPYQIEMFQPDFFLLYY